MLILASASKARKSLLKRFGIDHLVIVSEINEDEISHCNVKKLVELLAIAKTESVVSKILLDASTVNHENTAIAVLGCDSLFEFNGEVFGKPRNAIEASDRLSKMSSKSGILHTGHCFMYRKICTNRDREKSFSGIIKNVISTKVNFSRLTDADIVNYVQTGEPLNCAGGFALEGKGSVFIESIEGCYSNVIGLSLPWLRNALSKALIPLFD